MNLAATPAYGYGYGAAGIPLPLPVLSDKVLKSHLWIYHPVFIGFLLSLLIMWLIRSCVMPVTRPSNTVLWIYRAPEVPEMVVTQPMPERVVSERREETVLPTPEIPQLMTRKETPERPMPVKKSDPILLPDRPVLPDMKKKAEPVDRKMRKRQMKVASAPDAVPEAIKHQQQRTEERAVYHQNSLPAMSPGPTPVSDLQSRAEPASRNARDRRAAVDFTPLPPAAGAAKPVQSSSAESRERSTARLAVGKRTVAVTGAVSQPFATAAERSPRPGGAMTVAPGRQFTPDLSAAGAPASTAGRENATDAARVTITGLVAGESSRVHNLKRMIFQKARNLSPGTYCCRIQDVQCRLQVTTDETISITFSSQSTSFDIVSRLERLLPEGVKSCLQ